MNVHKLEIIVCDMNGNDAWEDIESVKTEIENSSIGSNCILHFTKEQTKVAPEFNDDSPLNFDDIERVKKYFARLPLLKD